MNTGMKIISIFVVFLIIIGWWFWWSFQNIEIPEVEEESVVDVPSPEDDMSTELFPITLTSRTITLDGEEYDFELAEGFDIAVAAEGLGKGRFMSLSPDGRLFVPDLVDYKLSHEGSISVLGDFNEETMRFESQDVYLSGLRGPNSVMFYTDGDGQDWIYIALTANLVRYPYNAGDIEPSGEMEIVYEFPNEQSLGEVSVVWHITRTLLLNDDTLYISIGSGCNSCEELAGGTRAAIIAMNPDGSNVWTYADGLRNVVGLAWADDSLYATENGVDHLGPDSPDEMLYKITDGGNYGWPYCYELDRKVLPDDSKVWNNPVACEDVPISLASFEPHAAALGVTYFDNFHEILEESFLVALHGSFDIEVGAGNRIVRVTKDGDQETFLDGFLQESGDVRWARPLDFFQWDENSFFFTDDYKGRLYYIYAKN